MKWIIDKIVDTGIVCLDFSGGEPFLRKDFLELVEYAYQKGLQSISIATNTLVITESQAQRLKQIQERYELLYLRVSLDGSIRDTHEWLRGPNTFENTLRKFKYLTELGIHIRELNLVISQKNYIEVENVARIVKDLGIKTLVILPLIPVGRANKIRNFIITPEQWRQLCIDKGSMEERIGIEIFADSPVSSTLKESLYDKNLPCMCGYQFLGIRPNGDYTICPIVSEGQGNILTTDIREFWQNSSIIQDIRNIGKLEGKCAGCDFLKLCRGGCRGLAKCYSGSYYKPDPMCWLSSINI